MMTGLVSGCHAKKINYWSGILNTWVSTNKPRPWTYLKHAYLDKNKENTARENFWLKGDERINDDDERLLLCRIFKTQRRQRECEMCQASYHDLQK